MGNERFLHRSIRRREMFLAQLPRVRGLAVRQMLREGSDTIQIAQWFAVPESTIWNSLTSCPGELRVVRSGWNR